MKYEILKAGNVINRIVAEEAFCAAYCADNGYKYREIPDESPEPDTEPSEAEQLRADVDFLLAIGGFIE